MQVKRKISIVAVLIFVAALLLSARSGPAQVSDSAASSSDTTSSTTSSSPGSSTPTLGDSVDQAAPINSETTESSTEADAPSTVDLLRLPVRLPAEQLLLAGLSPTPAGPNGLPGSSNSLALIAIVGFGVLAGGIASAMRTRRPAR